MLSFCFHETSLMLLFCFLFCMMFVQIFHMIDIFIFIKVIWDLVFLCYLEERSWVGFESLSLAWVYAHVKISYTLLYFSLGFLFFLGPVASHDCSPCFLILGYLHKNLREHCSNLKVNWLKFELYCFVVCYFDIV